MEPPGGKKKRLSNRPSTYKTYNAVGSDVPVPDRTLRRRRAAERQASSGGDLATSCVKGAVVPNLNAKDSEELPVPAPLRHNSPLPCDVAQECSAVQNLPAVPDSSNNSYLLRQISGNQNEGQIESAESCTTLQTNDSLSSNGSNDEDGFGPYVDHSSDAEAQHDSDHMDIESQGSVDTEPQDGSLSTTTGESDTLVTEFADSVERVSNSDEEDYDHFTSESCHGSPTSNTSTEEQLDDRSIDLLSNASSDEPNQWENPTKGFPVHTLCRTLLFLATKARHSLSFVAMQDIVQLVAAVSGCEIPQASKYHWKNVVNKFAQGISFHHLCKNCGDYVGKSPDSNLEDFVDNPAPGQILECESCHEILNIKENFTSGNVFIHISLTSQLKDFLELHGNDCKHRAVRAKKCSNGIEDIYDGSQYKHIPEGVLTLNFSCDGVPVFDSSQSSIYPILCTLNDLEPRERREHVMLSSIWFGQGKPKNMNAYLKPFVNECCELAERGVTYYVDGLRQTVLVKVLMGISDSVARPMLRCSTQFNGQWGCGLCLHPGENVPRGRGFTRVYPIKDNDGHLYDAPLRNHQDTLTHAVSKEYGIKGRSILCDIPDFDIITSLDCDWMHCVALGVCRQFAKCWFDPQNHENDFYFGHLLHEVDEFLMKIKPSLEVSRTPRRMSDRKFWKAHEWVIWLLFYSIPTLSALFPRPYVKHWSLLVDAISILSKTSIMKSEILYSERCITQFVEEIPLLYGKEHVSFNAHLLTHLPNSVLNFGPLWTHSAFVYEDFNQDLLSFVQSSKGVALQICDSFRLKWALDRLEHVCRPSMNEAQLSYLDQVKNKKSRPKPSLSLNGVSLLGDPKPGKISREYFLALLRIGININQDCIVSKFLRAVVSKEVVHTKEYTRVTKRKSNVVLLHSAHIFEIHAFVVFELEGEQVCYAIGTYFKLQREPFLRERKLSHLVLLNGQEDNLAAVEATAISEKVTFIEMPAINSSLACIHPNHVELLI